MKMGNMGLRNVKPKRDGCTTGEVKIRKKKKNEKKGGEGGDKVNGTDLVAVAIHEIDQGAKVTADDVTSASRTSPDELAYDQVVGKKATRDISPNEIVKKGSVSKT